jgi:sugar phosphate isomerase/epimerase
MPLKLGAYTACLHDRPLAEALDVLKADGLTSVEVNTGGFISSPHCHVDALLASAQARRCYLAEFTAREMELTGLNCNGNPLNPLPGVGPKHRDDLRRTIELAGRHRVLVQQMARRPGLAVRRGRHRPRRGVLDRIPPGPRRDRRRDGGQHRA